MLMYVPMDGCIVADPAWFLGLKFMSLIMTSFLLVVLSVLSDHVIFHGVCWAVHDQEETEKKEVRVPDE